MKTPALPWRRLILSILVVAMSTQPVFLLAASFLQLEDDIGLSTMTLGLLTAAFFLAASVTSAPLGRVVEWIGWRRAMRINAVGSAAVLITIGLVARNIPVLALLLVVGGAVYGLANPAANSALAERVDPSHRGITFGLKHAGIPVSTLLAGLAVPLVILAVGWQGSFLAAALLLPVIWLLLATDRDSDVVITGANLPSRGANPMSAGRLAVLALSAALATWAAISLSTFLVAAAVEASLTEASAGLLLFAGSVVSISARIVAGRVADRTGGRGFTGLAVLMGVGAVVFLAMVPATGPLFATLVLVAFATGWGWPGLMTFTVVNANAGTAAASSAITQAGVFLGAGVGPILLGWTIDSTSFATSWALVSVSLITAAVIAAVVGTTNRAPSPSTLES